VNLLLITLLLEKLMVSAMVILWDILGVCVCGREKREKRVECEVRSAECLREMKFELI